MDHILLPGVAIVIALAWTVANGLIAREKHRSLVASIISSVLFTPVVTWLYLVAVPSRIHSCPSCHEWNAADSGRCHYCGGRMTEPPPT